MPRIIVTSDDSDKPEVDCPSTLRARLRDDTPPTSPSDKPIPYKNNIYHQVHASLGTHLTVPKTTKKVIQKVIQKPEKHDAAAQLRDRYARMGLNIHTTAIARLMEAKDQVEIKREEYANTIEKTLRRSTRLYDNIRYPLSATIATSADGDRGSFNVRISRLRQDLAAAREEITRLNDEAIECRRIEAQAWKEFKNSIQDGRAASSIDREAKAKADEFKEEARAIVRDKNRLLEDIDADFKGKIQEETQRMMMDLLSGI